LQTILKEGLLSVKSAMVISKPVSVTTSAKVGVIGPWPKRKAFDTSDQKYEAAMSIGT
jgi:hypothetical protein